MTLIPVHFAKFGRASTVGGIFNCCTYIGSAISTYGFGAVSEKFGWTATVVFWIILGVIGVAACALPMRRYARFATEAIRRKSTAFLDKKSQYPIKRVKKQHEAQKN